MAWIEQVFQRDGMGGVSTLLEVDDVSGSYSVEKESHILSP
uniref:Uncharacterized protein n=1 Tax=Arundo donax TaxID=35708 RepID=A0A0A9AWB5_ARUDO